MQSPPRRAIAALVVLVALALAACGGSGYGDPIAATDGGAGTTALAPAPVTTPGDAATDGGTASGGAASSDGSAGAPSGSGDTADDTPAGPTDGDEGDPADDDAGSDDDAAASIAAYASDANRFCTGFKDATRSLATEIAAAGTDTAGVGRAIVRYGDNVTAATAGLRAAPVPDVAREYHRRTLAWVSGVSSAIRSRSSGLRNGNESAGATVIREVQALGQPPLGSQVPSALRGRATACTA